MFQLKRKYLLLLYPFTILLILFSALSPEFAEWYALTIYPIISHIFNALSSLFPVSLSEIVVLILLFGIPIFLLIIIWRFFKSDHKKPFILRAVLNFFCLASVILFCFTVNCGINYGRYTFSQVSGLSVRASSQEELAELCRELVVQINELRPQLPEDANGMILENSLTETGWAAKEAFDSLHTSYPTLSEGYGPPKPVFFSRALSACNITGIFFPFTFEANVNVDIPDYSIPFTMCHELTHLRGYMREDEANFIAYLACRESDRNDFQYSGALSAFIQANNALYARNSELASEIYNTLNDAVKRDVSYNNAYWKQFEGPVADTASKVNDVYLKANRQQDGVESYGRMVDLLLADYRKRHQLS